MPPDPQYNDGGHATATYPLFIVQNHSSGIYIISSVEASCLPFSSPPFPSLPSSSYHYASRRVTVH